MSEQPRYFLDCADKITSGPISAEGIKYDWKTQQFFFRAEPFTAEEHFQRAAYLIAELEDTVGGHADN